jgi:ornithine carbamoyltransferase
VAHSLMEAGALAGMHLALATPREYGPGHDFTIGALALAAEHGGSIQLGHDPRAAVAGADVVYGDAWVPKAQDAERERCVAYQVDDALMHLAAPGAVVMSGLPARCGLDMTAPVIGGASSLVCEQAANRLPTAQAMLHGLVGSHHRQRES